MDYKISKEIPSDAKDVVEFYNYLGGETDFLSFGENEYSRNEEQHIKYVQDYHENQTGIFLVIRYSFILLNKIKTLLTGYFNIINICFC